MQFPYDEKYYKGLHLFLSSKDIPPSQYQGRGEVPDTATMKSPKARTNRWTIQTLGIPLIAE